MTKDEIISMAREAGLAEPTHPFNPWGASDNALERFAVLVAAAKDAEHKEAMRWDIHSCGPTCKRYACVATREAVAAEREACAKVCEEREEQWRKAGFFKDIHEFREMAFAIRARGKSETK